MALDLALTTVCLFVNTTGQLKSYGRIFKKFVEWVDCEQEES